MSTIKSVDGIVFFLKGGRAAALMALKESSFPAAPTLIAPSATDDRRLRVEALISGGSGTTVSKNKAFTVTHVTVAVGAGASAVVKAANPARVWAVISVNGTGLVHLACAPVAATTGVPLNGRGSHYEIGPDNYWEGDVSVFNTTGAPININVMEGTNP